MANSKKRKLQLKKVAFTTVNQPTKYKSNTTVKTKKKYPYQLRQSQRILQKKSPNAYQYSICNIQQLEDLFFNGYRNHNTLSPGCNGQLRMHKTEQRIISVSYKLKCDVCDFITKSQRLYKTTTSGKFGGKPASTLNLALGNALLNSPIGIVPFREISMRIGLNPGSAS